MSRGKDEGRRDNGEGTVYFSEARSRWIAELTLPSGQRKKLSGLTEKEVKAKLNKLKREREDGLYNTTDSSQPFGHYYDGYLERHAHEWSFQTRKGYASRLAHLKGLRNLPINRLTPRHFQELYAKLLKTLEPVTVRAIHELCRTILEEAFEVEILPRNPVKKSLAPKVPRREYETLTREQILMLFAAAKGHRFEAAYVLAFSAGLREGEISGLCWNDINWQIPSVVISHKLLRRSLHDGGFILDAPKSAAGRRELPLQPYAVEVLQTRLDAQLADKAAIPDGAWGNPWGLVFTNKAGKPVIHHTILRQFRKVLGSASLPVDLRIHDLRHTCATLMREAGVPSNVISEYLGHSSVAITDGTYIHVTQRMRESMTNALGSIMPPPQGEI